MNKKTHFIQMVPVHIELNEEVVIEQDIESRSLPKQPFVGQWILIPGVWIVYTPCFQMK